MLRWEGSVLRNKGINECRLTNNHFRLILQSLLVICYCSISSHAADKYIRKGAAGAGTSWTDAYGELSNTNWTGMGGSTLWIAAGNYTSGLPDLNMANVTIKRATVASHGAASGWSDAYDGQVTA